MDSFALEATYQLLPEEPGRLEPESLLAFSGRIVLDRKVLVIFLAISLLQNRCFGPGNCFNLSNVSLLGSRRWPKANL